MALLERDATQLVFFSGWLQNYIADHEQSNEELSESWHASIRMILAVFDKARDLGNDGDAGALKRWLVEQFLEEHQCPPSF